MYQRRKPPDGSAVTEARPLIMLPGRYAETTSVTRWAGVVNARALLELVFDAGGEPLTVLPRGEDWFPLLNQVDGVLLPGGSDIDPSAYGGSDHPEVYGVDSAQDHADITLARETLNRAIPLLAVCRGFQVVNVARGGTLLPHMKSPHQHTKIPLTLGESASRLGLSSKEIEISCYHHQTIDRLGDGIAPVAWAPDGVLEAAVIDAPGYAIGVQWHPEDNYLTEPAHLDLVRHFVEQARSTRL